MHRPAPADNLAAWGKLGVYKKRYNLMLGPADLDGTQALTYRYARDTRFNLYPVFRTDSPPAGLKPAR